MVNPNAYVSIASQGVIVAKESRDKEKKDMQDPNERLANCIETARFLEARNRMLEDDLKKLKDRWGSESNYDKEMYEAELKEARRLLEDTNKDKHHLEVEKDNELHERNELERKSHICSEEYGTDISLHLTALVIPKQPAASSLSRSKAMNFSTVNSHLQRGKRRQKKVLMEDDYRSHFDRLRWCHLILIFAFTLNGSFRGVTSKLTDFPTDTLARSGTAVRLRCSTDQSKAIYWERKLFNSVKQETFYYGDNGLANVESERYMVDKKPEIGQYDLVIKEVRPEDAGTYICTDEDGFGIPSRAELVIVSMFSCLLPMSENGFMGENMFQISKNNIRATCTIAYRGNRVPRLRWFWNSVPVEEDHIHSYNDDAVSMIVSQVNEPAEMKMNGKSISCRAQLTDNTSTIISIEWTSKAAIVRYSKYEIGKMEDCPGASLLPQCNPPCIVQVKKLNSFTCECVSVYRDQETTFTVTIGEFSCGFDWRILVATYAVVVTVGLIVAGLSYMFIKYRNPRKKDVSNDNGESTVSGSLIGKDNVTTNVSLRQGFQTSDKRGTSHPV